MKRFQKSTAIYTLPVRDKRSAQPKESKGKKFVKKKVYSQAQADLEMKKGLSEFLQKLFDFSPKAFGTFDTLLDDAMLKHKARISEAQRSIESIKSTKKLRQNEKRKIYLKSFEFVFSKEKSFFLELIDMKRA